MKIIYMAFLIVPAIAVCQPKPRDTVKTDNSRISFIIGPGASLITSKLYDHPAVNQSDNTVKINEASRIKTNIAIGIIYTHKIFTITRNIKNLDANDSIATRKTIERVPKGITTAAFINPVALSKVTESQPFFSMIDFGVGIGHRFAGGLVLL
jgi:hypothetical protein